MSLARHLERFLQRCHLSYVYGMPGEGILDVLDALREGPVHFVATRQLWAAGYAAMGHAWASRGAALCLFGSGVYGADLVRPARDAARNWLPVVFVGPPGELTRVLRSVGVPAAEGGAGDGLFEALDWALDEAAAGVPGPVLVERSGRTALPTRAPASAGVAAASGDDAGAVSRIFSAGKPVVLAGSGVPWDDSARLVSALSRAAGAPVAPTVGALGAFPPDDPFLLPAWGLQERDDALVPFGESDLVAAIGVRPGEVPGNRLPDQILHVGKGTLEAALDSWKDRPEPRDRRLVSETEDARRRVSVLRERMRGRRAFPPNPVHVMDAAVRGLTEGDAVVVDTGMSRLWAGRFLETRADVWVAPSGISPGSGLPFAMGVKLARPARRVLLLCGDASYLMACPEIETMKRMGLPLVGLVQRDAGLGWIKHLQDADFGRGSFESLRLPNLIRLTKVLGGNGERLERGDELRALVFEGLRGSGPMMIDIPTDFGPTGEIVEAWGAPRHVL